jgi:putative PEP-CTERM system histidine kinase
LLFAAIVLLMMISSSGRFRSRLKVFISKHFFSYRYDYREKWLRFTAALSTDGSVQRVQERTIMALADLVDSPGGLLWLKDDSDRYAVTASCNIGAIDASERVDGELAIFMSYTGWIISDSELRTNPSVYGGLARPSWLDLLPSPWLIIPLASGSNLLGFVVLTTPRTPIEVDWEVRDLLKTASRQAASYLGQIRATEALLEARKFDAFNRMSAFVVHDLKNLIAQLSLMLRNATRHSDNPAFQADMLSTVENVVERMNALMLQLRTTQNPIDPPRNVDIVGVVQRVCRAKADARIVVEPREVTALATLGHEDRLEHVIGHLVQNALDASPAHAPVHVRVECDGDRALVTVSDKGIGMTREFVRDRLFKPFQTTKSSGMGIGVYESAQYVASIGGEIRIDSRPDEGTRVWLRMPLAETPAAVAIKVQAA